MSWLLYPFWNVRERRLRAGWRIMLQLAGMMLIAVVIAVYVKYAAPALLDFPLFHAMPQLIMLFSAWAAARALDRRRFRELGLRLGRDWWVDCAAGLVLGLLLIAAIFLIADGVGWLRWRVAPSQTSGGGSRVLAQMGALLVFALVGFGEESMFRGYQLRNIAEGFNLRRLGPRGGLVVATILTSLFFASVHMPQGGVWLAAGNTCIAGVLLAVPYVMTGRLGLSVGLHISWNYAQGCLFGFPVSGMAPPIAVLAIDDPGPALWTGGDYGPEGGLLGTIVFTLAIGVELAYVRLRYGPLRLCTSLAEYAGVGGADAARVQEQPM